MIVPKHRRGGLLFHGKGIPMGSWAFSLLLAVPTGLKAADFLNVAYGARAVALGEAYTALAEGPESLYWNPAGLAREETPRLFFQAVPPSGGAQVGDLGLSVPTGKTGGLGASLRWAGAGDVNQTDESGNELGTLNPQALAISLGYGRAIGERGQTPFAWGINGRYVRSTLLDTADTVTGSAGILSSPFASNRGRWGLSYSGGGKLTYDQRSESLPRTWRVGGSFLLAERWRLSSDVVFPSNDPGHWAIGTEYDIPLSAGVSFIERVGYNTRWKDPSNSLAGLSFGLGARWDLFVLDYAYRIQGGWDTHVVSLSVGWGPGNRSSQARALVREGQRLRAQNKLYESILKLNEALQMDPNNEEAKKAIRSAAEALRGVP